jgi:hypothetical protein
MRLCVYIGAVRNWDKVLGKCLQVAFENGRFVRIIILYSLKSKWLPVAFGTADAQCAFFIAARIIRLYTHLRAWKRTALASFYDPKQTGIRFGHFEIPVGISLA